MLEARGQGSAHDLDQAGCTATSRIQFLPVTLHLRLLRQRVQSCFQDARGVAIRWGRQAVMHPFAFAPGRHHSCAAQVSEVAGNFRLGYIQNLNQITDTDFLTMHEVEKPKAGGIGERAEQAFKVGRRFPHDSRPV